jgi:hypothetical protein
MGYQTRNLVPDRTSKAMDSIIQWGRDTIGRPGGLVGFCLVFYHRNNARQAIWGD